MLFKKIIRGSITCVALTIAQHNLSASTTQVPVAIPSAPYGNTLVNTPETMVRIVADPISSLCALYKETGDSRVLALIERLASRPTQLEQTKHITDTIKNAIWWGGICTVLYLWWQK